MNYKTEVSYLEIKLNPEIEPSKTLAEIESILGPDFSVKDPLFTR